MNYVLSAQIGQDGLLVRFLAYVRRTVSAYHIHFSQSNIVPAYAQGNGSQGLPIQAIALFSQGPVAVNQETSRLATSRRRRVQLRSLGYRR